MTKEKETQVPLLLTEEEIEYTLHEFLNLEFYKDSIKEFEGKVNIPLELRISYRSSSDLRTGGRSGGTSRISQQERDTIRFEEEEAILLNAKLKVEALEKALDAAITSAAGGARISNRGKIATALYDNLVLGVPCSMLRKRVSKRTMAKYRNIAIENAALNLKCIGNFQ